jgi:hypothetical protein
MEFNPVLGSTVTQVFKASGRLYGVVTEFNSQCYQENHRPDDPWITVTWFGGNGTLTGLRSNLIDSGLELVK